MIKWGNPKNRFSFANKWIINYIAHIIQPNLYQILLRMDMGNVVNLLLK